METFTGYVRGGPLSSAGGAVDPDVGRPECDQVSKRRTRTVVNAPAGATTSSQRTRSPRVVAISAV
jgi:hypothetical protein